MPPERAPGFRLSRRQALAAGGGLAGAAAVGGIGALVVFDEFEDHLAGVLGISPELARELATQARDRLGGAEYELRAAAFFAATAPGSGLLPTGVREAGVRRLLGAMINSHPENTAYVGLLPAADLAAPCAGLGPG